MRCGLKIIKGIYFFDALRLIQDPMLPEIHISGNPSKRLSSFFEDSHYSKVLTLVDKNALGAMLQTLEKAQLGKVMPLVINEQNKNLKFCEKLWEKFSDLKMDRKSLIILVGGGVLGDLGGFAASNFKRGVDFVNIPTTLLSMTDSTIGGKQGINFQGLKNQIGSFAHPKLILVEPKFLKALPDEEIFNGYAEILKHAAIRDREFFFDLNLSPDQILDWEPILERSIGIKVSVVEEDPKEEGLRKILNFGHTFGHAMETYFIKRNQAKSHGYCVAIGMLVESSIAHTKGILEKEELKTFSNKILRNYDLPSMDREDLFEIFGNMRHDKKNEQGKILMSFMTSIGEATFNNEISESDFWNGIEIFQDLKNFSS